MAIQGLGKSGTAQLVADWETILNPPKTNAKKKSWLSSLISEAGGTGGAVGGAALGTAILPGVGTLLGAVGGGFLGGTGGRVVENKVRDNRIGLGDALKEGALTGALGFVPGVGTATRGAISGARAGTGVLSGAGEALATKVGARTAGTASGRVTDSAYRLTTRANGIAPGSVVAGRELGANESRRLYNVAKRMNAPLNRHVDELNKWSEDTASKVGQQLDELITKNNRALSARQTNSIASDLRAKLASDVTLASDPESIKIADRIIGNISGVKDVKGLIKARRDIDKSINFGRGSNAATPERENIFRIARETLDKKTTELAPGLKTLNKQYADLQKLGEAFARESKAATGRSKNVSASFTGGLRSGDLGEAVKKRTGNTLLNITGGASEASPGLIRQTAPYAARASLASALDSSGLPTQEEPVDLSQYDPTATDPMGDQSVLSAALQSPQSPYTAQNLMADIQRDPKNTSKYLDLFDSLQSVFPSASESGPNVTKVTAQQYGLAQSGQAALQQLSQLLSSDPNVLTRAATPGRGLPGVGGFIANAAGTGDFDAITYNIADSILRLRTGATANEGEVRKLQSQIIPRAGDSPQTVRTKLGQIEAIFGNVLSQANQAGTGTSDLATLLAQSGYGG